MSLAKRLSHWFLLFSLSIGGLANASPFVWAPDMNVGDTFPRFKLSDQDGNVQTNSTITGEAGYLIQFHRSVVW